ncbi:uncharacterized protein [Dermacentor andersoni]|uniref:uncharacterized protein n=1 Tax=Dermacentor andersoni TaxID=34620 RepID=UPI003B3A419C
MKSGDTAALLWATAASALSDSAGVIIEDGIYELPKELQVGESLHCPVFLLLPPAINPSLTRPQGTISVGANPYLQMPPSPTPVWGTSPQGTRSRNCPFSCRGPNGPGASKLE